MKLKRWIVAVSITVSAAAAWALPSVQDVESAVKGGHYAQAESMMKEVVDAKPNSAKGHYLYAEILAHNARFSQASDEANAAERLDPAIRFTQPEKFRAFQQLLVREQHPVTTTPATRPATTPAPTSIDAASTGLQAPAREAAPRAVEARSAGVPGWIWLVGLGLVGYFLWRGFSRSRTAAAASTGSVQTSSVQTSGGMPMAPAGYGPNAQYTGYGPGGAMPYGAQPPAGRGGSWVGTGLAAAGGVAAGMMLDRALHANDGVGRLTSGGDGAPSGDLGQLSHFGTGGVDDDAARELENRNVDFGAGNDWGGDAGSFDSGGGSDGGGWD